MKRSEMIEKIRITLAGREIPMGIDWPTELLDIMEAVGMVPPLIIKKYNEIGSKPDYEITYTDYIYEWEPENE